MSQKWSNLLRSDAEVKENSGHFIILIIFVLISKRLCRNQYQQSSYNHLDSELNTIQYVSHESISDGHKTK